MKNLKITKVQIISNKANLKKDFTYNLIETKKRYVVSVKNIYEGFNPSLNYDLNLKINEIINKNFYDSIGGWYYKNIYYLDANVHFYCLDNAVEVAKLYNQIAIFDKQKNKTIIINKQ